jgi:cholesterol oxidase
MGDDASNGVVDSLGRVFRGKSGADKYQGLYVVDGSIIPTSLGVNPSLTITRLAFRIAFHIVGAEYLP